MLLSPHSAPPTLGARFIFIILSRPVYGFVRPDKTIYNITLAFFVNMSYSIC